jgi:hypothetical protein
MFTQEGIQSLIKFIMVHANTWLMPMMVMIFLTAVVLRLLVHYTASRELWFAKEFYRRVHSYLDKKDDYNHHESFYVIMKKHLEKTYYEIFVVRAYMKRRNPDYVMSISDRFFLIQDGCARLVKETLRQISFLRHQKERPRFIEIAKNVFDNNPCFKKVLGILPVQGTHDILLILTGIFIIAGIFGTFLGIMAALPELGNMELDDAIGAKAIMDNFLAKISFSMSSSIIGIVLSVLLTFINTMFDPEKLFLKTLNKFENTMELLWDCSENNHRPADIADFDQHRDPIEALAEDSVDAQINAKNKRIRVEPESSPTAPEKEVEDGEERKAS